MWQLASFLNIIIGTTLAGTGVIAALVMGFDDMTGVLAGAAFGFVVSLPVTWLIARQILSLRRGQKN